MSAIWHDHGQPSFLSVGPGFSFHELAECHEVCPASYASARFEMNAIEFMRGAAWYRHNAELAHKWFVVKQPWYL